MVSKSINLEQVIAQYLLDAENEGQRPATLKKKRKFFKRLIQYSSGESYSERLNQDFLQHLRGSGLAPNSIRTYGVMLRALSNWMAENDYATSFSKKLKIPKEEPKMLHLLSMEKTEEVIIAGTTPCKSDHWRWAKKKLEEERPALLFVIKTGVRNKELRGLRGCDLNLDDQTPRARIIDAKSGRPEFIPLPVDMIEFLRARLHRKFIFNVNEEVLRVALARGCRQLGVHKIGVHDLRHTFATNYLRRRTPLQIVSRLLRHSNIAITDKYYSHYIIEDLAIEMNTKNVLIQSGISDDVQADYIRRQLLDTGVKLDNIHIDVKNKTFTGTW